RFELRMKSGERKARVLVVIEDELLRSTFQVTRSALLVAELALVRVLVRVTALAIGRRELLPLRRFVSAVTRSALKRLVFAGEHEALLRVIDRHAVRRRDPMAALAGRLAEAALVWIVMAGLTLGLRLLPRVMALPALGRRVAAAQRKGALFVAEGDDI